jgi:hypothetical protein
MKLYEMSRDYVGLLESDLDPEQLKDCLESIGDAIEEKASNIIKVVNCLNSDVAAIDNEITRLQARKKSITNNQDRLKEYLRYNMELSGITKIEHPLFKITLGKGVKKVSITNIDLLDDEFIDIKTEIKPNLNKIKEALKSGDVNGAVMIDGLSRLLIK